MKRIIRTLSVTLVALGTGCGTVGTATCDAGEHAAVQELIYFGRDKAGGPVSESDWAQFLNETVTPRFPAGLSSWQASGQWQSASGALVREPSYVLSLVHTDDAETEEAVQEIVATYKSRFEQEAVLRVKSQACTSL